MTVLSIESANNFDFQYVTNHNASLAPGSGDMYYKHLTMTSCITSLLITVNLWLNNNRIPFKVYSIRNKMIKLANEITNVARQILVMQNYRILEFKCDYLDKASSILIGDQ